MIWRCKPDCEFDSSLVYSDFLITAQLTKLSPINALYTQPLPCILTPFLPSFAEHSTRGVPHFSDKQEPAQLDISFAFVS